MSCALSVPESPVSPRELGHGCETTTSRPDVRARRARRARAQGWVMRTPWFGKPQGWQSAAGEEAPMNLQRLVESDLEVLVDVRYLGDRDRPRPGSCCRS